MEQSTIALIIIAITIVLMVTEKIPLISSVILCGIAMHLAGILKLNETYTYYGSVTVVFLVGMMIISNGLFETGVAQSIGKWLFQSKLVKSERLLIFAITIVTGLLSGFLSNSAVTAMMIPLVASVAVRSNGLIKQKNILLAVGAAATVGGSITLSGAAPQVVAQGLLETAGDMPTMTYFQMAPIGLVLTLVTALYFATIGYSISKRVLTFDDVIDETVLIDDKTVFVQWKKTVILIVTCLVVLGFVLEFKNIAFVAMTGAIILVASKTIDVRNSLRNVDWNTVIILGAAQSMARGLEVSGAGKVIADGILNLFGGPTAAAASIMCALVVIAVILTQVMSNTACVAMMGPIVITLARTMDINVMYFLIPLVVGAGCAVATPIATPCMTQVLVGGYRFRDYMKVGVPLGVILAIVLFLCAPVFYAP